MSVTPWITKAHLDAAHAWGRLLAATPDLTAPDYFTPEEKAAWREGRQEGRANIAALILAATDAAIYGTGLLKISADGRHHHIPLDELRPPVPPAPADRET